MHDFPHRLAAPDQSGMDFLRTELALAFTFLDVAQVSRVEETQRRNEEHAYVAYQTVVRFLKKLKLSQVQRQEIEAPLSELKMHLQAAGYSL